MGNMYMWENYLEEEKEHLQHQKKWEKFKRDGRFRRTRNGKINCFISRIMTVLSIAIIFYVILLFVLYFLDGKGI